MKQRPFLFSKSLEPNPPSFLSLDEVKDYLHINGNDFDESLHKILKSAVMFVQNKTRKILSPQQIECLTPLKPPYKSSFKWPFLPFIHHESLIGYKDYDKKEAEKIEHFSATPLGLEVEYQGYWIECIYKAGYESIPEDLKEGVLMVISYLYNLRFGPVDYSPIKDILSPYVMRSL